MESGVRLNIMSKQEPKPKPVVKKSKAEQYERDLELLSQATPEDLTQAVLSGAGTKK